MLALTGLDEHHPGLRIAQRRVAAGDLQHVGTQSDNPTAPRALADRAADGRAPGLLASSGITSSEPGSVAARRIPCRSDARPPLDTSASRWLRSGNW